MCSSSEELLWYVGLERIVCQIPERIRDKAIRGSFGRCSSLGLRGDLSGYRGQIVVKGMNCKYVEEERQRGRDKVIDKMLLC